MSNRFLAATAALVCLPAPVGVWAQSAAVPAPAASSAASEPALNTVVITAQKRAQSAQQAGLAVSVLSGDELAARGVRQVNQLANEVPSLEIEPAFGGGQAQFRLRGVGFQDYASNNAGAVTVYVDEVALPLPVQTQGLLFDLDRVEVLRGPQGTLYGRNTTGGAVNFHTRQPTRAFEAGVTLGAGSYGAAEAEAYLSGPLGEHLRGRIAVATQQGGGWQRNRLTGARLGDRDLSGVRAQLQLDATRDLTLGLSLHAGRDQSEGQGLYLFTEQPAVPGYPVPKPVTPADRSPRATGWGFNPAFLSRLGYGADAKPGRDNDSSGLALRADWRLGTLQLSSITAADRFDRRELADYDAQVLPLAETFFGSKARNVSQELRLASHPGEGASASPLQWVAGLYWAEEKLDEQYASSFTNSFGFANVDTSYRQRVRTASVFGQADWAFAPGWKLVAGLRQERERRSREHFVTQSIAPDIVFTGPSSGSVSNDHTSGKLGLEFQASRQVLAYASVSRGVKSGGFTAYNTFNEVALTPFKPEVLVAWEAGLKAEPARNLRVNAALYHYNYRDQQILDAVLDTNTGATVGKIVNAPRSRIDGVELEVLWKPSPALSLSGLLGYKDGKFKDYLANSPPANLAGQRLYFPRLNAGLAASYGWRVGDWSLLAQADASYHSRGRSFLNRVNPAFDFATPAYWLGNARVELSPPSGQWTAALYVRNLGQTRYDLTRNFFDLPLPVAAAGAPRTWGAQLRYHF